MKLYSLILFCLTVFIGTGCSKDTEDIVEGTVYYPVFNIEGSQLNYVALGSDFVVPKVTIMDGPTDITSKAVIEGEIDLDTPGYYEKTYTATTADGYSESKSIKVFVYHPSYKDVDITGEYAGLLEGFGGGNVGIEQVEKGVYILDDFYGGYYVDFKEYGAAYKAKGFLIYVGDNKFVAADINSSFGSVVINGDFNYDTETGIFKYGLKLGTFTWKDANYILKPVVED